jgi:hypothetical protein
MAREHLEAAVLRLVAEHAETFRGDWGIVAAWLRSLADDPAELSLLAVRPDERPATAASAAVLPEPADRAAPLREAADIAEEQRQFEPATGARKSAQVSENVGILRVVEELRRVAAQNDEAEKLAKARRMAKAFSAPPVAPPGWDATKEWPMRHKQAGDRRVHATAPFSVNMIQRIWTACGKQVGEGGYPLSHMPVDCRECRRATTAVEAQQPETQAPTAGEPIVQTTKYTVNLLPETDINAHVFELTVEYRGHGQWAVLRHGWCLDQDGSWDYELRPSEREDEWIAAHRFDLDTALNLAKEAAPGVIVNGLTAADALARLNTEEPTQ